MMTASTRPRYSCDARSEPFQCDLDEMSQMSTV